MAFLVSTVQGMKKNIQETMQNQKSLERVVETKFHNMDVKVTELTTIVRQLQHEVDSMEIPRLEDEDEYEDDDDDEDESVGERCMGNKNFPTHTKTCHGDVYLREEIWIYVPL